MTIFLEASACKCWFWGDWLGRCLSMKARRLSFRFCLPGSMAHSLRETKPRPRKSGGWVGGWRYGCIVISVDILSFFKAV